MRIFTHALAPSMLVLALVGCSTTGNVAGNGTTPPPAVTTAESASPSGSAVNAPPPAPPGPCEDSSLAISIADGVVSPGHTDYQIIFTNNGTSPCYLKGFPTVFVVGSGSTLGAGADPLTDQVAAQITIAPGGKAQSHLQVVRIEPNGGALAQPCTLAQGDAYGVTAPNSTVRHDIPWQAPACTNGTIWMVIYPIVAS